MSHANEELEVEILTRRNFLTQTVVASCACAAACVFAGGDAEAQTKKPGTGSQKPPGAPGAQQKNPDGVPVANKYTVGPLASFAKQPDGIYDKYAKAPGAFLVVLNEGKIYALSSVCTHKKRLIHTYPKDKKQAICPAHSSVFDLDGTPTPVTPDGDKTPARDPLPRHGISVDAKGIVVVDTSKTFTFEQRNDEGAFVEKKAAPAAPAKEPAEKPKTGTGAKKPAPAK
jgi:nitrite reductase/ring-hydroxylating ferredoxin subunit